MSALRGRTWWLVPIVLALAVAGCAGGSPRAGKPDASPRSSVWDHRASQWVSFRNVEVRAPREWAYGLDPSEPECIARGSTSTSDPSAGDVPREPYVVVGLENQRPSTYVDCGRGRQAGDPDLAFGWVPFGLWQPYVKVDQYRPHQGPEGVDTDLTYRGWHLLRTTSHGVQVTVLAAPGDSRLGDAVVDSLRVVTANTIGCAVEAPSRLKHLQKPVGDPVPAKVGAIAICQYSRIHAEPGLEASRLLTGRTAPALARAIGSSPLSHSRCTAKSLYGEKTVLRFYASAEDPTKPLAEAYVYLDTSCSDGIADADGLHVLTRQSCAPLFTSPPLTIFGGNRGSVLLCRTP